jgi:hypothetical protein
MLLTQGEIIRSWGTVSRQGAVASYLSLPLPPGLVRPPPDHPVADQRQADKFPGRAAPSVRAKGNLILPNGRDLLLPEPPYVNAQPHFGFALELVQAAAFIACAGAGDLETVREENWFFRLSRYSSRLRHAIESGPLRIEPDGRRNEILSFIDGGLEDFSISRSVSRAAVSAFPCPVTPVR